MNSGRFSAEGHFDREGREEMRFLRDLKGVLREEISRRAAAGDFTQAQLAADIGMDPGQLSRALSPDWHVNSRTLFRIAYALDRRWVFRLSERAQREAQVNLPAITARGAEHVVARSGGSPIQATKHTQASSSSSTSTRLVFGHAAA
jgi:transcriptional regulator with XRE-family HTH domain